MEDDSLPLGADDDLDNLLDRATELAHQQPPKKGRRAPKPQETQRSSIFGDDTEEVSIDAFDFAKPSSRNSESAQARPARRGGWGAVNIDSGKTKNSKEADEEYEDERLRAKTPPPDDDSDTDIPAIPELQQEQEIEHLENQFAIAPHVVVNRVATYKELDSDLLQHTGFLSLDNEIDLKLLSKGLSSHAAIHEDDVTWEWDHLFTEVSSELLAEWNTAEKRPED